MTRKLLDILCETWDRVISADEALEEIEAMETPMPKREWQGLTDEEIDTVTQKWAGLIEVPKARLVVCREYARAIEAKLKEKNT